MNTPTDTECELHISQGHTNGQCPNRTTPTDTWICPNPDCEWSNPKTVGVCNNCGCPKNHKEIVERLATPTDGLDQAFVNLGKAMDSMITPTDNAEWIDKVLINLVDEWASFMLHGRSPEGAIAVAQAKQAILTHIDTVCREARQQGYHKGYQAGQIGTTYTAPPLNPNKEQP